MQSADSCSTKIHSRVQREMGPESIQMLVQHRRQSAILPTMSCFPRIRSSCLHIHHTLSTGAFCFLQHIVMGQVNNLSHQTDLVGP